MLRVPNMGNKALSEMKDALRELGFTSYGSLKLASRKHRRAAVAYEEASIIGE